MQCTGLIRHWLIGRFPERPLPTSLPLPPSHSWVYLPPILLLATHSYTCNPYSYLPPILTLATHTLTGQPYLHLSPILLLATHTLTCHPYLHTCSVPDAGPYLHNTHTYTYTSHSYTAVYRVPDTGPYLHLPKLCMHRDCQLPESLFPYTLTFSD